MDMSGKILFTHQVKEGGASNWQLERLAEGIYLIDYLDQQGMQIQNQRITIIK